MRHQVLPPAKLQTEALGGEADIADITTQAQAVAASQYAVSAPSTVISAEPAHTTALNSLNTPISTLCLASPVTATDQAETTVSPFVTATPSNAISLKVQAATQNVAAGMQALEQAPLQLTVSRKATSRARLVLGLVQSLPPSLQLRIKSTIQHACIPGQEAVARSIDTSGSWEQATRWLAKERQFQAVERRTQQKLMCMPHQARGESHKHGTGQILSKGSDHDVVHDASPRSQGLQTATTAIIDITALPAESLAEGVQTVSDVLQAPPTCSEDTITAPAGDPPHSSSHHNTFLQFQNSLVPQDMLPAPADARATTHSAAHCNLTQSAHHIHLENQPNVDSTATMQMPSHNQEGLDRQQQQAFMCTDAVAQLLKREGPRAALLMKQKRMQQHVIGSHQETSLNTRWSEAGRCSRVEYYQMICRCSLFLFLCGAHHISLACQHR